MKVRVKATGEIINIADYARVTLDKCDSYGDPIELSFDEVEILQERSDNIDWEQRRYELAKAAMQGILSDNTVVSYACSEADYKKGEKHTIPKGIARFAITCADALINELKALGCPLKYDVNLSNRPFVDWMEVENTLIKRKLI